LVITPNPLREYVPIETSSKGVPVVQWEKDAVEESGLVKIDLLGNRSLGVIRDAVENVKINGAIFDERRWQPEDDPDTRAAVARGDTMGCFYIESPAMRLLQKKASVGDFRQLVIHSSIIRPAANDFIREYVRRLHGGQWKALHPLLEDTLEETFGIMVYQEDVAKTAVALAGFSHVDADGLRKIMAKKDKDRRLENYKQRFTKGARARGVAGEQIDAIWRMMMSFSGYSFCKPHSASYARVSFQAAYLKTHHPAEFMAAVISNQGGFYSTFAYVSEAQRMGISIQPPDVNSSDCRWLGAAGVMRVGLSAVKGVDVRTCKRIVERRKPRPYRSLSDFLARVQLEERDVRSLILAGALDALHRNKNRPALLWQAACWQKSKSYRSRAGGLFAENGRISDPRLPPETEMVRLRNEFSVLGFLCDRHPMTLYADMLKNRDIVKAKDLPGFVGRRVRVAGLLITEKTVHTKHGAPMEFLTFEDDSGLIEATLFPKVYRRFCSILDRRGPFILHGKVTADFGAVTMTVTNVDTVPKLL
jgi:DNA polymerase-3 subunit alpha/error-prone DNA polymerase